MAPLERRRTRAARTCALVLTLLPAVAGAAGLEVHVSPARLVLGKDKAARLDIALPNDARARRLKVLATSGTVQKVEGRDGKYAASWLAPAGRTPEVVGFAVFDPDDPELAPQLATVALWGSETLTFTDLPPNARVEAMLGLLTFGPTRADARGRAQLDVLVPPGTRKASVTATPPSGAAVQLQRELTTAAGPGDTVLAHVQSSTLAADGRSRTSFFAFVLDKDGRPSDAPLTVSAGLGKASLERQAAGRYAGSYTAPFLLGSSDTFLTFRPKAGKSRALPLKLTAAGSGVLTLRASREELFANALSSVELVARVTDDRGKPLAGQDVKLTATAGSVAKVQDRGDGEYLTALTAPAEGAGPITVTATAPGCKPATVVVKLVPAPPLTVELDPAKLVADGAAASTVRIALRGKDGRVPPDGTLVRLASGCGKVGPSVASKAGLAEAQFVAGTAAGSCAIEVSTDVAKQTATAELVAGPPATIRVSANRPALVADGVDSELVSIEVEDRFGNPLPDEKIDLVPAPVPQAAAPGKFDAVAPVGGGRYQARFISPDGGAPATLTFEARAGQAAATGTFALTPRPPSLGLSLRGGLQHNLGTLAAPSLALEGDVRLGFVSRRTFLALGTGFFAAGHALAGTVGETPYTLQAQVRAVPVSLAALLRVVDTERGFAYLGAGGDAFFVQSSLQASFEGAPRQENSAVLGFHGRLGGGVSAGPGAVVLDVRYTQARLPEGSVLAGALGGVAVQAGYRLNLL